MAEEKKDKTKLTEGTAALVKQKAEKLFELMGVGVTVAVQIDEDEQTVKVNVESEKEKGLLIGKGGETLESIQSILGLMLRQETGEWVRVVVDVAGWRERKEEWLRSLAQQTAEKARETGEDQPLYNLSASQRRVVHLALAKEGDIETESVGEGQDRYLIVRLKKPRL